ncbi:prolipoprotein diacylglyceryl transferase [Telmatospirillum sp. J64-1]|uniref:prolipoprotein diacylglyceryl transferase n=1 Tax=Telmatospirillum sp. J64-1 TaxID=2502183 RepID=UPI00115E9FE1|nr:prolipoprotein diacylglyceryl transferase [Telmatospirillum sp. J64-1]
MAIAFPDIDPVALQIGPIAIRWYALAYITGLMGGWAYLRWLVSKPPHAMTKVDVDDFLVWATVGVVLGGRLGYVLFYQPAYYLQNPLEILFLWQGGMAFHGGALGVIIAIILFSRRRGLNLLRVGDMICCTVPIGLFFGRIANFINGELWGRPAPDVPWAVIFPTGGPVPRHPSQLYQAAMEGLLLFLLLHLLWRVEAVRMRAGTLAGTFLAGYGIARMIGELFRQPDAHIGFLAGGITMGQVLSLPMVAAGLALILWPRKGQPA